MITDTMKEGIKESMATVLVEMEALNFLPKADNTPLTTEDKYNQAINFLNNVTTKEDFFGVNKQGLAEYNNFIAVKEQELREAKAKSKGIRTQQLTEY